MQTYLGNIAPLPKNDAKPHLIDIVVQLGRTRRFGGCADPNWTVLHHSMLTALLYIRAYGTSGAERALLHDGAEYIIGDIPTPVKRLLGEKEFNSLESFLDKRIQEVLGLGPTSEEEQHHVEHCDAAALFIEAFHFEGTSRVFEHLGETTWRPKPQLEKEEVARIIQLCCPEVYEAMLTSKNYNYTWSPAPWGIIKR